MIESAIAEHYLAAQRSFVDLARSLSADEWATPVPCTPAWTVRDVLSHVSGITDDAAAGRLDGATTEPWTAAQIERNRNHTVHELLDRWEAQTPGFAAAIASIGEVRPPVDCHTHEHDVRHAIGRPGNRRSDIVNESVESVVVRFETPLAIELVGGPTLRNGPAAGPAAMLRGVTAFEVFRSCLGRRSAEQVDGYDWSGPDELVAAVRDKWFIFGPSETAIIEHPEPGTE